MINQSINQSITPSARPSVSLFVVVLLPAQFFFFFLSSSGHFQQVPASTAQHSTDCFGLFSSSFFACSLFPPPPPPHLKRSNSYFPSTHSLTHLLTRTVILQPQLVTPTHAHTTQQVDERDAGKPKKTTKKTEGPPSISVVCFLSTDFDKLGSTWLDARRI